MTIKGIFIGLLKFIGHVFLLMIVGAFSTLLTLRFFTAGDEVVVPDLKGKQAFEAIQILNQEGLQLKIHPQKRYSNSVPAERVLAQNPAAKQKIKQGRSIEVYMSLGPEKAIVPDLLGQTTRVAAMSLNQRGLHQGKVLYVSKPGADPDQILAQYPPAGTELIGTRTVDMLVNSSGGDSTRIFVMPDVIGKPISDVTGYFKSAGLRVGVSQGVDYPGVATGTVVKQNPPAGYKVSADTFIGLYYSK
jgi:eukaryotic-like serine/threonine-protein kinase